MLSKSVGDLSTSDLMGLSKGKNDDTSSTHTYSGYLLKRSNNPWEDTTAPGTMAPTALGSGATTATIATSSMSQQQQQQQQQQGINGRKISLTQNHQNTRSGMSPLLPPLGLQKPFEKMAMTNTTSATVTATTATSASSSPGLTIPILGKSPFNHNHTGTSAGGGIGGIGGMLIPNRILSASSNYDSDNDNNNEPTGPYQTQMMQDDSYHAVEAVANFFGKEVSSCYKESPKFPPLQLQSLSQSQNMEKDEYQFQHPHQHPHEYQDNLQPSIDDHEFQISDIFDDNDNNGSNVSIGNSSTSSHIPPIPKSHTQPIAIAPTTSEESDEYYDRHLRQNHYYHQQGNHNHNHNNREGAGIGVGSYGLGASTGYGGAGAGTGKGTFPTLARPPPYVRMTSEPAIQKNAPQPPPPDYIDKKDGHIWRAKYCILENGTLYFYPNAEIGNCYGAQQERLKMSSLNYSSNNNNDINGGNENGNGKGIAIKYNNNNIGSYGNYNEKNMMKQDTGTLGTASRSSEIYESDHLAKSPMPRRLMQSQEWLNNANNDKHGVNSGVDSDVYWEKRVELNIVRNVRSNPDYGGRVFELLAMNSEEERDKVGGESLDRLLLRAPNEHEMNCWIFEIHRSFIFLMKQIAEIVGSVGSSAGRGGNGFYRAGQSGGKHFGNSYEKRSRSDNHRAPLGRFNSSPISPGLGNSPSFLNESLSKSGVSALSHGHGRSMRVRRIENEENGFKFLKSSTPSSTPGGGSSPARDERSIKNRMQSKLEVNENETPETLGRIDIENDLDPILNKASSLDMLLKSEAKESSPIEEIIDDSIDEKVETSPQVSRRYVPPHERRKNAVLSNVNSTTASELSEQVRLEELAAVEALREDSKQAEELIDNSSDEAQSETNEIINLGLGGCADPSLVNGSICDPEFVEEKASRVNENAHRAFGYQIDKFEIGAVSICGVRDYNEDSYLIINDLLDGSSVNEEDCFFSSYKKRSLYAIFDGHCGNHAARYAAEKLQGIIVDESEDIQRGIDGQSEDSQIKKILNTSIARVDREFCELCSADKRQWYSGTTAIVALFLDKKIYVANVGDCRGVIFRPMTEDDFVQAQDWEILEDENSDMLRNTESHHIPCSEIIWTEVAATHSPSHEQERIRIESANGWTKISEQEVVIASQFQTIREHLSDEDVRMMFLRWFSDRSDGRHARILDIWRVCGDLAVSRAIGDREYKAAYGEGDHDNWKSTAPFYFPNNHSGAFDGDLIVSTPDINCFETFGDQNVLLLACDGLWDVLDPDDAVRLTRKLVFERGLSAKESAQRLAELAGYLGSSDNITVIIVRF